MNGRTRRPGWVVVIPIKPTDSGKSRLAEVGLDRPALAAALAVDTIAAAAACAAVARVLVVTDDPDVAAAVRVLPRVDVVGEGGARGVDGAVALGAAQAGDDRPRAALLGDLPSLDPADLARALRTAASVDRAVVADREGTGTTMVTARAGVTWMSAFGPGSFARHAALGFTPLAVAAHSTLRRDVDTPDQLRAAADLGLGAATRALLAGAARPPASARAASA